MIHRDEEPPRSGAGPPGARRQARSYAIANRSAEDVVALLERWIEADVVPVEGTSSSTDAEPVLPSRPTSRRVSSGNDDGRPPPLSLAADLATNRILAAGEPRLLDQLDDLIRRLDVRRPQVLLEVLVARLNGLMLEAPRILVFVNTQLPAPTRA